MVQTINYPLIDIPGISPKYVNIIGSSNFNNRIINLPVTGCKNNLILIGSFKAKDAPLQHGIWTDLSQSLSW
jgi:hypothetical protein